MLSNGYFMDKKAAKEIEKQEKKLKEEIPVLEMDELYTYIKKIK